VELRDIVPEQSIDPGGEALAEPALKGRGTVPGQMKDEHAAGAERASQGGKALGEVGRFAAQT
jgi:hypothetical protein